ncbi:MAG: hypothetical protein ACTSRA_11440, partial [Promethearchaeota archaeon]
LDATLIKTTFEELKQQYIDTKYLKVNDLKVAFYLGAYVADTAYNQNKYFNTNGVLKKLIGFLNNISWSKTITFFNTCEILQKKIQDAKARERMRAYYQQFGVRKKIYPQYRQLDFITTHIKGSLEKISEKDWNSKQEDLIIAFTLGYLIYLRLLNILFEKISRDDNQKTQTTAKAEDQELSWTQKQIQSIMKLPNFGNNLGFEIGLFFGIYYYLIASAQRKNFKTNALIKKIFYYLRNPDLNGFKYLLKHTINTNFKLISIQTTSNREREGARNKVRLPFLRYLEHTINLLVKFEDKLSIEDAIIGFLTGICIENDGKLFDITLKKESLKTEHKIRIKKGEKNENKQEKIIDPIPIDYVNYLEEIEFKSDEEKLAYYCGVYSETLNYKELNTFKTKKLLKNLFFRIRHFNFENLLDVIRFCCYADLIIWQEEMNTLNKESLSAFTTMPKIKSFIFQLLGKINMKNEKINENDLILAFMFGYQAKTTLYSRLNKEKD